MFFLGHLVAGFACILNVIALTLIFISFLSPVPERHRALITIKPNITVDQYLASGNDTIFSPSVIIGVFGSCTQVNSRAFYNCTKIKGGKYSLDALPKVMPKNVFKLPGITIPAFMALSIVLLSIHISSWAILKYLPFQGKIKNFIFAWLGEVLVEYMPALSMLFGLAGFVCSHTIFNKMCHDFNEFQKHNATVAAGDTFIASTGNGFLLAWLGYGFLFHTTTIFWVVFFKEPKAAAT